jgi:transcription-repair coupling factor (superfamily II helicase)
VGRSNQLAYCYFLVPEDRVLSEQARKRLAALREFSDLGAGFRIAARDLEIRGAGNLLGGEQSGHIEAVGFDMYMKLLEQTIKELKGEEIEDEIRATVNLRVDLRIDESYIPDMNQRLTVYRRMAGARSEAELERSLAEVKDRYGAPPPSISNLADYALIRLLADRIGVESIDREAQVVVLKFRPEAKLDPQWLLHVLDGRQDLQLAPPATLKLDLNAQPSRPKSTERPFRGSVGGAKPRGQKGGAAASWWTARATAGEVTGGFSKEEILRPAPEDPRAESGVFARVTALLRDLGEGATLR